jgi:predicted AlkP superfamily phosphohydrolase/phosphomutase
MGFMLSGMDTPSDEADFAYPPAIKAELERPSGGYQVFGLRSKTWIALSPECTRRSPCVCGPAGISGRHIDPTLMILVFMETDVIQHKCWKYLDQRILSTPVPLFRPAECLC